MSGNQFQWASSTLTHAGKLRKVNEDACLEIPWKGIWAVADGMGGHSAGDVASQMVVNALSKLGTHNHPADMIEDIEDRITEVNKDLFDMCDESGKPKTIGSTVAILLGFNRFCIGLWAGDSRIYRFRNGRLQQVSRDHSQVEELINRGEILREDAASHRFSNVITRAVGGEETLKLDMEFEYLQDGDRYLLCTDGLLKDVDSHAIAECLSLDSSDEAARSLVQRVLDGDATDNVSVAVVDFSKSTAAGTV